MYAWPDVGARLARLLLVALVALACCACTRGDDVIELTRWTLVTAGNARRDITLPGRFSAQDFVDGSHVVLETVVDMPPGWHDAPATLSIPVFFGSVILDESSSIS